MFLLALAGTAHAGTPTLPNIPAYTTNVTQAPYNASGDGVTDNTTVLNQAIHDVNARGGGTVEIPGPGVYLTGPLTMKSKINLQIDAGATLRMLPYGTWPTTTPLLTSSSLSDLELSGGGGIDGQGAAWYTSDPGSGLYMLSFSSCNRVLIQNLTISNAPAQQIVFKGKNGNVTIQGITIKTPSSHVTPPAKNTDGIDLVGTNCVVQNCSISTGDDNIALGSSSSGAVASDILVTNCAFGDGHGMSIGSNTAGGVSNLVVVNCTFNGTDYGIRMKSDNASSGGSGEGGITQNLSYYNLGMTNIRYYAILIYSYYSYDSSPSGITPAIAASQPVAAVTSNTPVWRNITISNLTATVASGGEAGMIWGRTELPATNIVLAGVNISAPANFNLYNAYGVQFLDSHITLPSGTTFTVYDAGLVISNSAPGADVFSLDGLAGTNSLALYNARARMGDAALLGVNPLMLSASTLSNSVGVSLPSSSVIGFVAGTNPANVAVAGSLALNSTLNVTNGGSFGSSNYTLFTYTGTLSGSPVLGTTPPGYTCRLDTNTARQVNLDVSPPPSAPAITNPPAGRVVLAGSNVVFSVGASGSAPLSYQWWFNATNRLAAGTNVSLTVSNAQGSNAGSYSVIVTNSLDSATSAPALLQVFASAVPTLGSAAMAANGQFSMGVTGVPSLSYAVQASTDLTNWTPLLTNTAPFVFTDTNTPFFRERFYRAAFVP
ncbi:MAG TPA: glycosyl hydrolase family 28 protein [Candidatus Acidoferrum sp.]|nr:glycosyl hydrolase family 28 protein [Candidatus Acidoferrum sp.]